ncbi:MAG: hypothetical protein K2I51_03360 [Muribaculaceae bacterium]|nr:hypothetical protein [Muribaculaceae bacterium]
MWCEDVDNLAIFQHFKGMRRVAEEVSRAWDFSLCAGACGCGEALAWTG